MFEFFGAEERRWVRSTRCKSSNEAEEALLAVSRSVVKAQNAQLAIQAIHSESMRTSFHEEHKNASIEGP